jgi:hypothetical protein
VPLDSNYRNLRSHQSMIYLQYEHVLKSYDIGFCFHFNSTGDIRASHKGTGWLKFSDLAPVLQYGTGPSSDFLAQIQDSAEKPDGFETEINRTQIIFSPCGFFNKTKYILRHSIHMVYFLKTISLRWTQIQHYSPCRLHGYRCNFFSNVLLHFGDSPRAIDVYFALEVSQEEVVTSGQIRRSCRPLNISIPRDYMCQKDLPQKIHRVWAVAPYCWNHKVWRSRPRRPNSGARK